MMKYIILLLLVLIMAISGCTQYEGMVGVNEVPPSRSGKEVRCSEIEGAYGIVCYGRLNTIRGHYYPNLYRPTYYYP